MSWHLADKKRAREMRLKGSSFSEITKKVGVPKSTLSLWLRDIPRPENLYYTNQEEWLKKIRVLAKKAIFKKRQKHLDQIAEEVNKDVKSWTFLKNRNSQRCMLALLHWAEGSKGRSIVHFANTDPKLALLFITLLRKVFELDESKFRIRLHLHYYHKVGEVRNFWSKLLNVPESQFGKIYRKHRSQERTFRKNFGGICFIKYNSVGLQERIMQYAYTISKQIVGEIKVPVV